MIVYITRHGQVDPTVESEKEHFPLTPLGRVQAAKLGQRLRELGFNGLIYTSPFHRCLETTEIICRILNARFYPEKLLRENGCRGQGAGARSRRDGESKPGQNKQVCCTSVMLFSMVCRPCVRIS